MVDIEPGLPGYTAIDGGIAVGAGESSLDEAIVAAASLSGPPVATVRVARHLAPLLSTALSMPAMATQSEVISEFFL